MSRYRVLLIDSDREFTADIERQLSARGCEVEVIGSAHDAKAAIERTGFDCVVVDVQAADAEGGRALSAMRPLVPGVPVIVTSAENSKELEAEIRRQGVFYYHVKSFPREEVLEAIEGALRRVQERQGPRGGSRRRKILLVEDDDDFRAAIEVLLSRHGYEVTQAANREEGMRRLRAERPDLVILDIMMDRRSDGFHFLYEMRADPELARIPVLSVTGISSASGFHFEPDEAYFPADDYLEKPVDTKALLVRVAALLA